LFASWREKPKKTLLSVLGIMMIVGFVLVGCGPLPTATPVLAPSAEPLGPAVVTTTPVPPTAPAGLGNPFDIFKPLIIQPATELLKFLYGLLGSYGLAIIAFTIIVRVVLTPLMMQQVRSQKSMSALQPQLQEIQKKYAKDKEKLNQETMRLYKEAGVNPLGGCFPLLIQMPILGGLYYALLNLSTTPEFRAPFLWLPNLADKEGVPYILIITMVASQFLYQRIMTPPTPSADPQQQATTRMMQFMPLLFAVMFINFPSGIVLYWVATNLVSIGQQYLIMRLTPTPAPVTISLTESRPQPVTISAPEERPSLGEGFRRLLGLPQPAEEAPPAQPPKTTSASTPTKPSRPKKKKKR
jgi:YidC/Oxa1 family membrane protein insertase